MTAGPVPAFSNLSAGTQSTGQASFHIEFRADTPNAFRPVAFRGKRHAQKSRLPVCAASTQVRTVQAAPGA